MFHTDVTKVDQDVAYVAMVVYVCCNFYSQCFIYFSDVCCKRVYLDVAMWEARYITQVCLSGYYIYFTHMLQVFYLDVAYVCNSFQEF